MTETPASPPARVASIDAYRGLVMFLMLAEVFRLPQMAKTFKGDGVWEFLGHHQSHVEWQGCSLHDLIQPSFSFLVGTALAFSVAKRLARNQPRWKLLGHAAIRALILIFLGIFLRSTSSGRTNFTFEDTLTQIGLGYVPLVILALARPAFQWATVGGLLAGYWLAFAIYPAPGPDFHFATVGVDAQWRVEHSPTGFAAHWDKNSNAAWKFDTWFLNLFPRELDKHGVEKPFTHNGGGYATLSFIPTLATMLLGLIAGNRMRAALTWRTVGWLTQAGIIFLAAGVALDYFGLCPNVKRIWTPSWTLFSGGWCFLILAGFVTVCDVLGFSSWSYPLRVIGANSIVAYCAEHLVGGFIRSTAKTHLWPLYDAVGREYEPLLSGTIVFGVLWLLLFWLYRRRIFIRI
jgi:heparan-alpha-glucosaminide N-acetyltransferase